jgi:hypothetical protein
MNSLNLKKLVEQSDCENNTDKIRELKHSSLIQENMLLLESLKSTHAETKNTNHNEFLNICIQHCPFLYNNYTEIFHKVVKDELNMSLMKNMLSVLKEIEDGTIDQHEGSVKVGTILKEIYIDSALKRSEKLDKEHESDKVSFIEPQKISWKKYKSLKFN